MVVMLPVSLLLRLAPGTIKSKSKHHTHLTIKVTKTSHQSALPYLIEQPSSRLTCDSPNRINILLAECSDLVQNLSLALTLLFSKVDGEIDSNG
jgi:hypothetical protein